MRKTSLLYGIFFLLLANTATKLLGFAYRIFLVRILGSEGIGLMEMVMPIYAFFLVIAGWGVPTAMSRLIARENMKQHHREIEMICRTGFCILFLSGFIASLTVLIFTPLFAEHFITDKRSLLCLKMLTPAIFIVAICSGYRAYFQGTKQLKQLGTAQNIEQILRVLSGIILAALLLPYGLEIAITATAIATVIGETGGLLYMILSYHKRHKIKFSEKQTQKMSRSKVIIHLLCFGTPLTIQRLFSSLLLMIQAFLIPLLLTKSGLSATESTAAYGVLVGVAMSLLNMPNIFTSTLSTVALPAVAESNNQQQLHKRINLSLQFSSCFSLPFMMVMAFYAEPLCTWIFHTPEAALPLQILTIGGFCIYAQNPIASILQGIGKVKIILINLILSSVLLFAAFFLLIPHYMISGAAFSLILFSTGNCLLNLHSLKKYTNIKYSIRQIIIKPFAALAFSAIILKTANTLMSAVGCNQYITLLISCLIAVSSYISILFLLRALPAIKVKFV